MKLYVKNGRLYTHVSLQDNFKLNNLEKVKAQRMSLWSAKRMPDFIDCFTRVNDTAIRIPHGIRSNPEHEVIGDFTEYKIKEYPFLKITPYDYQEQAVEQVIQNPVGLIHATTGSGKTIIAMMLVQRLKQRTLIVCKDKTLMYQMVQSIKDELGLIVRYVVGDVVPKKYTKTINTDDIVVTTIQSATKEDTSLYSMVILDEVHAFLGSDDRRNLVGDLQSKYIYGLTATPIINDMDERVFDLYLGNKVVVDYTNMTPDYCVVNTDFNFVDEMLQEFDLEDDGFHLLKEALYNSEGRTNLIVETIKETLGNNKGIVFTDRIEYADKLENILTKEGIKIYKLIGSITKNQREIIKQELKDCKGPCIVIGSVQIIGTGFDVPELSRGYLTTTTRFKGDLIQYVGRIIRKHPTKPHPVFYDFTDEKQSLLKSQGASRRKSYKEKFPEGRIYYYNF